MEKVHSGVNYHTFDLNLNVVYKKFNRELYYEKNAWI